MDGEPLIVPIGHRVGAGRVRRGASFHELDETGFRAWTLAHGAPDALHDGQPWQRRQVVAAVAEAGVHDPEARLNALCDKGFLAEVAPDDAVPFARAHRMLPLMVGLGSTAGEPDLFGIGFLGQPVLHVGHVVYDLWQWSAMDDTLWATCENAAEVARRAGSTDAGYTDPRRLLDGLLGSLPALLCTHAACLDVPVRLGPAAGARPEAA